MSLEATGERGFPGWLEVDPSNFKSVFKYIPEREEITIPFQEQMIVELYSK
jgi:small subunit ribosomal protein S4